MQSRVDNGLRSPRDRWSQWTPKLHQPRKERLRRPSSTVAKYRPACNEGDRDAHRSKSPMSQTESCAFHQREAPDALLANSAGLNGALDTLYLQDVGKTPQNILAHESSPHNNSNVLGHGWSSGLQHSRARLLSHFMFQTMPPPKLDSLQMLLAVGPGPTYKKRRVSTSIDLDYRHCGARQTRCHASDLRSPGCKCRRARPNS